MTFEDIKGTKVKRVEQIVYTTNVLIAIGELDATNYTLDKKIVSKLVDHYCRELVNIKDWYNIKDKANTAKVAAIMVSAIIRFRPWIPKYGKIDSENRYNGNEIIAIYQGLALCAVENKNHVDRFMNSKKFDKWFNMFKFVLRNRYISTDVIMLVFETIKTFDI